jgi:hypothetical protein
MTVRGVLTAGCLMAVSFGCAWSDTLTGPSEVRFTRSLIVPAADGVAEVRRDENGNAQIDIKVDHLAPPERIAAGATSYVVWVKAMRGDMKFQNLGAHFIATLPTDDHPGGGRDGSDAERPRRTRSRDLAVASEHAKSGFEPQVFR